MDVLVPVKESGEKSEVGPRHYPIRLSPAPTQDTSKAPQNSLKASNPESRVLCFVNEEPEAQRREDLPKVMVDVRA